MFLITCIVLLNAQFMVTDALPCPSGFISFMTSCYHFSHDTESWFGASGICDKFYNGFLVEINDATENNFIITQAKNNSIEYWIGANDLQVEGEWKWLTSKSDVTTATWGAPPSNSGNDENCAEILNGAWNDDSCHKAQHYICEYDQSENEVQVVG